MKHTLIVTIVLVAFFVLSQVAGLYLINKESSISVNATTNATSVNFGDTAIGARPDTTGSSSLIYVLIAVAIGTGLVLLIARFGKVGLWKIWFFLAVWMAISVSVGAIVKKSIFFDYDIAIAIALVLAAWKILRPNVIIHNLTEVLMYAGIGLILVPIFDVTWAVVLLLIISVYDMYAVWHSRHMIKMAQFQTKSNVFAGLMVPYSMKGDALARKKNSKKVSMTLSKGKIRVASGPKTAILGGGDIAFPLIFSGTVMDSLIMHGMTKSAAFLQTSIITFTTTIALALLFVFAKKDKFYPAMPFITAGCLIGWVIVLII